jgi:HEAT repeat protein
VRRDAALALASEGTAIVPSLLAALDDPDAEVRCAVVYALGRLGALEAVRPLTRMLTEDRPSALEAARALGRLGALDALLSALLLGDEFTRRAAVAGLGQLRDRRSLSALYEEMIKGSDEISRASRASLLQIGVPEAVIAVENYEYLLVHLYRDRGQIDRLVDLARSEMAAGDYGWCLARVRTSLEADRTRWR